MKKGSVEKQPDVVIKDDVKTEKETEEAIEDIVTVNDTIIAPEETQPGLKTKFRIALIMPFNTDEIKDTILSFNNAGDFNSEKYLDKFSPESEQSIQFYQGLYLGLKENELNGLKVDLHIYDSHKSEWKTQGVLQNEELETMDLIIGPMFNHVAQAVANFSRDNKIYNILPFSPSSSITSNNPYHIKINPSIEVHCKNMYQYIADTYSGKNIVIIYRNNNTDVNLSNIFRELSMETNDEMLPPKMIMYDEGNVVLEDLLEEEEENIVIVSSLSEAFAQNIMRILHLKSRDYDITLFGMPNWIESSSLNLDHFESLKFHTTLHNLIEEEDPQTILFNEHFLNSLNSLPIDQAYTGYDIGKYFGNILLNNGRKLAPRLKDNPYHGLSTQFRFEPKIIEDRGIQYYENTFVHIVKFEDYELKAVYHE